MFKVVEIWDDSDDGGYKYIMVISVNESGTELVDVVVKPNDDNFWYFLDMYDVDTAFIYNKTSGDFVRKPTDDEYERLCDYIEEIIRKVGNAYVV